MRSERSDDRGVVEVIISSRPQMVMIAAEPVVDVVVEQSLHSLFLWPIGWDLVLGGALRIHGMIIGQIGLLVV